MLNSDIFLRKEINVRGRNAFYNVNRGISMIFYIKTKFSTNKFSCRRPTSLFPIHPDVLRTLLSFLQIAIEFAYFYNFKQKSFHTKPMLACHSSWLHNHSQSYDFIFLSLNKTSQIIPGVLLPLAAYKWQNKYVLFMQTKVELV